jgi:hypothetical protein
VERLGIKLVGAWYSDADAFCQVSHVFEFGSLAALEASQSKAAADAGWVGCQAQIDGMIFARRTRLLEPFALPPEALQKGIDESREKPLGVYTLATLEVEPGKMPQLRAAMEAAVKGLPMVANWRSFVGNPNEVIDVWKGGVRQGEYRPSSEGMNAFFRGLRQIAPRERLRPVFTLPYSPLR